MNKRYLLPFAATCLFAYLLAAGCTQDFNVFKPCATEEKYCGNDCVALDDPSYQSCDTAAPNGCDINLNTDPANCGACGKQCIIPNADPGCAAGACTVGSCTDPWEDCDKDPVNGCEAKLDTSPVTCGSCDNKCPPFYSCKDGQCILECELGKGDCDMDPGNGCETTLGDTKNCGFCGDACDLPNATSTCNSGLCAIESCKPGFADCDGMAANGCEADLDNSPTTCGACDRACGNQNVATAMCKNGTCNSMCMPGFGNCDQPDAPAADDGCETSTGNDVDNCGMCGKGCSPNNATGACVNGACTIATCTAPFDDCDKNPGNGCEVNTSTSVGNCGGCGNACNLPNAVESCNNGTCGIASCNNGFGNCDNNTGNGCETNTATSTNNCGACGRVCNGANVDTLACAGGLCTSTCDPGFGNCSRPAAPGADNGCETNTDTDVDHCGSCTRPCSNSNVSTRSCTAGLCDSACPLGRANCNMPAAPTMDDGCEVNSSASTGNCGGCGNNCGAQGGSTDQFECDTGAGAQKVCGCSNNNECRGPGVASGSNGGQCSGGLCQCNSVTCNPTEWCILDASMVPVCTCNGGPACTAGQLCCQTPAGCTNIQTDAQNCGACGHKCAAGKTCVSGACQ